MGWIGYDLDGCLAEWGEGTSNPGDVRTIGKPIIPMVLRLRADVLAGQEVKIFTARVGPATTEECWEGSDHRCGTLLEWTTWQTNLIDSWMVEHVGYHLPITATKDFHMIQLYDDRCKQVIPNTGELVEDRLTVLEAGVQQIAQALTEEPLI